MTKAVEVVKVHKSFGDVKAVDGISVDVNEGTIFGLLGPNGAGKTTLIRMMATLSKPDKGRVLIEGIDVALHPELVRPRIGLAGQYASVDEFLTGRENIVMIGRLYHLPVRLVKKRADDLLAVFGLSEAANRQVKTYSGGMRRRLDLAASLVAEPSVLFLDEPTTGLDPRSRYEAWEIIKDLTKRGTTILLTTQYLDEADFLARQIAVMDMGKIVAAGTSNELKNRLGGDIVEFKLASHDDCQKAKEAVLTLAKATPTCDEESRIIRIPVAEGPRSLLAITRKLDEAGIEPVELSLHRPSLDDVFLALTGQPGHEKVAKEKKVQP